VNGFRSGVGTLYWKHGHVQYTGEWTEYHGRDGYGSFCQKSWFRSHAGMCFREDGSILYKGGWSRGKRQGYGVEYDKDEVEIFCGHNFRGRRQGLGFCCLGDGVVAEVQFDHGRVVMIHSIEFPSLLVHDGNVAQGRRTFYQADMDTLQFRLYCVLFQVRGKCRFCSRVWVGPDDLV